MPRTPHFLHNRGLPEVVAELRKPRLLPYSGWIGVGTSESGDPEDPLLEPMQTAVGEYIHGISPPFLNNWKNVIDDDFDYARMAFYMSADGEIRFRGHVRGGAENTNIFRLPVGYRPEYTETFRQPNDAGGSATISVGSDGFVKLIDNSLG